MKLIIKWAVCLALLSAPIFSNAQDQTLAAVDSPKTLELEQPIVLKARKVQPYEITPGTVIQMALLSTGVLPVAQVTTTVYDFYGNPSIPAGSRLVGRYFGMRGERNEIKWDELQLEGFSGTFRIDPPVQATMPDGSTGIINYSIGQPVATIVAESFIVPHHHQ